MIGNSVSPGLAPGRVDYMPIDDRPTIRWPNDARVALWISPNVEWYEYLPPERSRIRDQYPRVPHPDVQQYSLRDYGNRVGFWRLLPIFDRYGIRCTVSLSTAVLEHCPEIAAAMVDRDWEYMSHGIYNTRYLYDLSAEEELAFLKTTMDLVRRYTGKSLKGMLGPAISSSPRTPDLMAQHGFVYHADWWHDDQPVPINVEQGRLISVPYTIELNDSRIFNRGRPFEAEYYYEIIKAQFDRLYLEGEENGRVMCIALHPFLTGQPHRAGYIDRALEYICSHEGVWITTADDIADHYMTHYYDTVTDFLRSRRSERTA